MLLLPSVQLEQNEWNNIWTNQLPRGVRNLYYLSAQLSFSSDSGTDTSEIVPKQQLLSSKLKRIVLPFLGGQGTHLIPSILSILSRCHTVKRYLMKHTQLLNWIPASWAMNRPHNLPNVLFYIQIVMPILGFFYPPFFVCTENDVILTE